MRSWLWLALWHRLAPNAIQGYIPSSTCVHEMAAAIAQSAPAKTYKPGEYELLEPVLARAVRTRSCVTFAVGAHTR